MIITSVLIDRVLLFGDSIMKQALIYKKMYSEEPGACFMIVHLVSA